MMVVITATTRQRVTVVQTRVIIQGRNRKGPFGVFQQKSTTSIGQQRIPTNHFWWSTTSTKNSTTSTVLVHDKYTTLTTCGGQQQYQYQYNNSLLNQQQKRTIVSWMTSIYNSLIDYDNPIRQYYINNDNNNNNNELDFTRIQPHHVENIIKLIQQRRDEQESIDTTNNTQYDWLDNIIPTEQCIIEIMNTAITEYSNSNNDITILINTLEEQLLLPIQNLINISITIQRLCTDELLTIKDAKLIHTKWDTIIQQLNTEYTLLYTIIFQNKPFFHHIQQYIINNSNANNNNNDTDNSVSSTVTSLWSAKRWIQLYDKHVANSNKELEQVNNNNNNANRYKIEQLLNAFDTVRNNLQTITIDDLQYKQEQTMTLANMYQYIGICNELRNKYQYNIITYNATSSTNNSNVLYPKYSTYIHELNNDIAKQLVPILEQIMLPKSLRHQQSNTNTTRSTTTTTTTQIDGLLDNNNNKKKHIHNNKQKIDMVQSLSPSLQQYVIDEQEQINVQDGYITYDGMMHYITRTILDLFGLVIVQERNDNNNNNNNINVHHNFAWHYSVRLYHIYDTTNNNKYLGSFVIDPYSRDNKYKEVYTSELLSRMVITTTTKQQQQQQQQKLKLGPIVIVSLQCTAPQWNDDGQPCYLSFDNCKSLLHELGHVLFMIVPRIHSCRSMTNAPCDFNKFLPMFMEHMIYHRTILYNIIIMSQAILKQNNPNHVPPSLSSQQLDALYRIQSRQKAQELLKHSFLNELEIEVLTKYNINDQNNDTKESLFDVQQRIAKQFIPYDIPYRNDLTYLLQIFQENANHNEIHLYRHLWCDVVSAVVSDTMKKEYDVVSVDNDNNNNNNGTIEQHKHELFRSMRTRFRKYLLDRGASADVNEFTKAFNGTITASPQSLFERCNLLKLNVVDQPKIEKDDGNVKKEDHV